MPLSLEDHHLVLLMEESNEAGLELLAALLATAKRCSKQLRFGRDEVQPGQLLENHQRLRGELLDVLACIRFLERSGQIEVIDDHHVRAHMEAKQAKIDQMLTLSRSQGRLEESIEKSTSEARRPCECLTKCIEDARGVSLASGVYCKQWAGELIF